MASIATEKRNGKVYRRVWFYDKDNRRRSVRLGKMNVKAAEAIARRVEALNSCTIAGTSPDNDLAHWIADLGDDLREKFRGAGFERLIPKQIHATLDTFLGGYIDSRDDYGDRTRINNQNTRGKLTAFFGADRDLRDIALEEAVAWRQWLVDVKIHSQPTTAKHVKRARHFFAVAVERNLCGSNPFVKVKAGSMANDARKQYIAAEMVERVIGVCPDAEWRVIVALSRFAGLRCPSETLELRWADIDWEQGRMTVRSKKTAKQGKPHRVIPIFAKLRPYLEEAFEAAEPGAEHVVSGYRGAETNLRTQLLRYIKKAGLEPWERAFHQMRASCQTDLEQRHGIHAATVWLGNSPKIAAEHYLSVPPEAFDLACGAGGGAEVVQKSVPQASAARRTDSQEPKEPSEVATKIAVFPDGSEGRLVPPAGFEPATTGLGNQCSIP